METGTSTGTGTPAGTGIGADIERLKGAAATARRLLLGSGGRDARALRAGTRALLAEVEAALPRLAICDRIVHAADSLAESCGVEPKSGEDSFGWGELRDVEACLTELDGQPRLRDDWVEEDEDEDDKDDKNDRPEDDGE